MKIIGLPRPKSGSAEKIPEARIAEKKPALDISAAPDLLCERVRSKDSLHS